ncbi:MAG: hypothetical protein IE909_13760, partial [Campylobacterales bacterium]|nr:hypothetical protein [Campylobacterales bacterium]
FDSIGDLDGDELKIRYGLNHNLMISYTRTQHSVEFGNNNINNLQDDIFLRYNLFHNTNAVFNSGLSFDFGYVKNSLSDNYMRDTDQLKQYINRIPLDDIVAASDQIGQYKADDPEVTKFDPFGTNPNVGDYYYIDTDGSKVTIDNINEMIDQVLDTNSYIALLDTHDASFYLRALTGMNTTNHIFDLYMGLKKTDIQNTIVGSIKDIKIVKNLNRSETMYFAGFNYTLETKSFIYEFQMEYDKFKRDSGLDYIDYNYIIDANIDYKISQKMLFYVGGKIMYRQFNGQIPYLYNQYTQTTYDHKYGYAKMGIQYRF